MRKILTTVLILMIATGGFAQLIMKDTAFGSTGILDGNTYIFYTELYNTSKAQVTPNWERTTNKLPNSWYSQICIGDLCYAETASEGTFIETMFTGDTSLISVYVTNDGSTAGVATVDLLIYDPADSLNNHASASFTYSAYPTGLKNEMEPEIKLYPNPAESLVYLKPNGILDRNSHVEIMDMTGQRVLNYPIGNADVLVYDVGMLESGVYLLSIVSETGKIELTKKLRVK